jgi:hypothetical protein
MRRPPNPSHFISVQVGSSPFFKALFLRFQLGVVFADGGPNLWRDEVNDLGLCCLWRTFYPLRTP